MEIERSAARIFRMKVDLPRLTERVGLHEMALVVNVKTMLDGVVLQVCDKAGDVDCH
jgi:hypothetical protein